MGKLILILGGARSGKSSFAEQWAKKSGKSVTYIATAQPGDSEMTARIEQHRADRPDHWITLEIPLNISAALQPNPIKSQLILLDCITILVSNLMLQFGKEADTIDIERSQVVEDEINQLIQAIHTSDSTWLVVSNEVGAGVVPPYPLGRLYRDLLGQANQRLSDSAEEIYYLIAGIALPLHQIGIHINDLNMDNR